MKYYSKKMNRMYDSNVTKVIPRDKIPVTEDLYSKTLQELADGNELHWDDRAELPVTKPRPKYTTPVSRQLELLHAYYEAYMRRHLSVSFELLLIQVSNERADEVTKWKDSVWEDYENVKSKITKDLYYFNSLDFDLNYLGKPKYSYQEVKNG